MAGAVLGSVRHSGVGTWPGAAIGAALGLGSVLIMRGDAVRIVRHAATASGRTSSTT